MIYIIDTYAWIEYFSGTKGGDTVKNLFANKENKFITMECCLAEVLGYCLRNKLNFSELYKILKSNSIILPVLRSHWIEAAKIRSEARKKVKDFGLIDSIIVAKQNELKCMVISGDKHFKNLKKIIFIGS